MWGGSGVAEEQVQERVGVVTGGSRPPRGGAQEALGAEAEPPGTWGCGESAQPHTQHVASRPDGGRREQSFVWFYTG